MFLKYSTLKIKERKNISDSTERLFGDDDTYPEQELNMQMYNLSLSTPSQPSIKQDIDDKTSIKDMQMSDELAYNNKTPMTPDYVDYFQQNDFSNHYQSSRYNQRGIHRKFIKKSMAQLRGAFSWRRGQQMFSNGDLNHSFNFEPYQQDLAMQCHPTEPESFKSSKDQSYKKSRRYPIRFHRRFFKGRHACDHSHESTLLLPRESQL